MNRALSLEFLLGNTLICGRKNTGQRKILGRWMRGVSFMPSQGYKCLAYGKLNEVSFIVDVQFVH